MTSPSGLVGLVGLVDSRCSWRDSDRDRDHKSNFQGVEGKVTYKRPMTAKTLINAGRRPASLTEGTIPKIES